MNSNFAILQFMDKPMFTAKPEGEWIRRRTSLVTVYKQRKIWYNTHTFVACMKHVLYSEEYIYYLQLKRYKCLSKLGRVLMLTNILRRYMISQKGDNMPSFFV